MKIEWNIETPLPDEILAAMEKAAERSTLCEGIHVPCFVCVRLCDDEAIQKINCAYRGIDRPTDVLSFPSVAYPDGKTAGSCEKEIRREYDDDMDACFLGDIIISVPHVYLQAKEYGHSVAREAAYLMIHGVCHLMGYDHMQDEEKKKMRTMEEKVLSGDNITQE